MYLVGHEDILDQRGNETGLSCPLVAANAYAYYIPVELMVQTSAERWERWGLPVAMPLQPRRCGYRIPIPITGQNSKRKDTRNGYSI